MSKRTQEFLRFAEIVTDHVENYAVPQYGDAPNDQVEAWTAAQCMDSVKRYSNRFESNARGRLETLRDIVKIAHYACLIFGKLDPTADEINKIVDGVI